MKILVYIGGMSGVAMHRLFLPYSNMMKLTDRIDAEFLPVPASAGVTPVQVAEEAAKYDAFIFSRLMPDGWVDAIKGRTRLICDVDDYWVLGGSHPLYQTYRRDGITAKLIHHMETADIVTTTTQLLAQKIRPYNQNILIYPNAINAEGQFARDTSRAERLRVGVIGGSSHVSDMDMLKDMYSYLRSQDIDRLQFVLAGFDMTETKDPKESLWVRMERILSDDYRHCSAEHRAWLEEYRQGEDDPFKDEAYRRLCARPIENYATLYNEIDVLMVPLKKNNFNKYKSPLKMIEASAKGKAIILPNIHPYRGFAISRGNCLVSDIGAGSYGFVKNIRYCLEHPDEVARQAKTLGYLTDAGGLFNLDAVCKIRIQHLLSL